MATRKSKTPNRSFKVADQIQRDLTELIARELKDPRIGMVTIQAVEVTPDYAHAKVYFSVMKGDVEASAEGLNQAAGFLRSARPSPTPRGVGRVTPSPSRQRFGRPVGG